MLRPAAIAGVEPTLISPEEASNRRNLRASSEQLEYYYHQQDAMTAQNGSVTNSTGYPASQEATHSKVDELYPEPEEKVHKMEDSLPSDVSRGLYSPRAFLFLMLWYLFSAFTLFQNKYILTRLPGDPTMLSEFIFFLTLFISGTFFIVYQHFM